MNGKQIDGMGLMTRVACTILNTAYPRPTSGKKLVRAVKAATAKYPIVEAAPELLEALKAAKQMLETAAGYLPKSIRNSDKFSLLNVLANSVNPAIAKAEGRE
jgi:hypothetical protein